jgi:hypothetical protein
MRRRIVRKLTYLSLLLVAVPTVVHAALERVGPVNPKWGYPDWYQDQSGLLVDFCTPTTAGELSGGWCLLLPPVPSAVPEVFPPPATNPDAFSVEHFYWAANANLVTPKAKLVMAVEGSFAGLTVVPGQQIAFARIRVFMPTAPLSGDYTIYHPFGVMHVPGIVAGGRLFFTQDVGLGCAPGSFDCVLATPIGPFLLPSATQGGPQLPVYPDLNPTNNAANCAAGVQPCDPFYPSPFTADPGTGRRYLADPARNGPVTGSPLLPFTSAVDNKVYNHNTFRMEVLQPGATVPTLVGESTLFAVQGRVFESAVPGHVTVDRASFARPTATGGNKLDVFATALPTVQGRIPPAAAVPPQQPVLVYYDAPCGTDATGALTVPVDPVTLQPLPSNPMFSAPGQKFVMGQSQPAVVPAAVCVEQTNGITVSGQLTSLFSQAPVTDQVFITESLFDPNAKTLSVRATSSDQLFPPVLAVGGYGTVDPLTGQLLVTALAAPPNRVTVVSGAGGLNERQVSSLNVTAVVAASPVAVNDAVTLPEDCSTLPSTTLCPTPVVINVLANDTVNGGPIPAGSTVAIVNPPTLGTATVNLGGTISYRPNLNANGTDSFAYSVTVAGLVSNAAAVAVTITPVNDAPVAVNDAFSAPINTATPVALNVFANDTDPDGAADLAAGAAVNLTKVTAPAGALWTIGGGAGGIVNFSTNTAGTYTFTYQARDAGGGQGAAAALLSNVGTVTVTATGATITIAKAQYVLRQQRLTVSGTAAPPTGTVTVTYLNAAGATLGTAGTTNVPANGAWLLDLKGVAIPTGATRVAASIPGAAPAVATLVLK